MSLLLKPHKRQQKSKYFPIEKSYSIHRSAENNNQLNTFDVIQIQNYGTKYYRIQRIAVARSL